MTPMPMTVFPAVGRTQPASPGQPVTGGESVFAALLDSLPGLVVPEDRSPVAVTARVTPNGTPLDAEDPAVPEGGLPDIEAAPILSDDVLQNVQAAPPVSGGGLPVAALQDVAPVPSVRDAIPPEPSPGRAMPADALPDAVSAPIGSRSRLPNATPVPAASHGILPDIAPVPVQTGRAPLNALAVQAAPIDVHPDDAILQPEDGLAVEDDETETAPFPIASMGAELLRPVVVSGAEGRMARIDMPRSNIGAPEAGTADIAHANRGQGRPSQVPTDLTSALTSPKAPEVSADSPAAPPVDQAEGEGQVPGQGMRPAVSTSESSPPAVAPAQPLIARGEALSMPPAPPQPAAPLPVARQVVDAILHIKGDSTEITLMPEELGTVRIVIARDHQGLVVTMTAERPEALDLLRRHGELLRQDLSRQGDEAARLDFQMAEQGGGRDQTGGRAARMMDAGFAVRQEPGPAEPEPMMRPVIVPGRLDMRM